jgi:predicted peroxiredoxin
MADDPRHLVVLITSGIDTERSSVAFVIALGGLTAGLKVAAFLSSSGVDLARRGATDIIHVQPLEPLAAMIQDFLARGGSLWVCPPCAKSRGYTEADLIEGATITGASAVHELIKQGAATLSF